VFCIVIYFRNVGRVWYELDVKQTLQRIDINENEIRPVSVNVCLMCIFSALEQSVLGFLLLKYPVCIFFNIRCQHVVLLIVLICLAH
jgi:hypothetical protein